ncbi:MAG: ABC transporter substrate-binding protein [Clostridia bacterium]|nr:ABC transporter substrate-binding protein [Clostridia bacterium]
MLKRKLLALAVSGAMVASLFAGCGAAGNKVQNFDEAKTVKIGVIQPITGNLAMYGTKTRDAIQLAVDEINAKGGVKGKQIELVVEDDENKPEKTLNAFTKLVSQDKVAAIIGSLGSTCTLSINQQAQQRKVVLITPSATNDTITEAGKYIFRACFNDSFQGLVLAKFAFEELKGKNAALLFDTTNDYSKGIKENFKKKFEEMGGKIVAEESYSGGDKDFKAQLTKIKGTNPDVLFIPDYYSTIQYLAPQVKSVGITAPMMGADGWDEATSTADTSVVGAYYSNHYSPDADDKDVKEFVAKFKEKYKTDSNALAALGYDAAYILAEAIDRAASFDSDKIQEEMMKTNRKFVTGTISYNDKRNPVKSAVINKIDSKDGKLAATYITTVNP